jgi:hypothetical protein
VIPDDRIQVRVTLLEQFLATLREYGALDLQARGFARSPPATVPTELSTRMGALRSEINRRVVAAHRAVRDAGALKVITYIDPPAIGGRQHQLNAFDNVFGYFHEHRFLPDVIEQVERAIGAYEAMGLDPSLLGEARQTIDIVDAVNRSLRPIFKEPPADERAVQDAMETILRPLGIDYHREKERAAVGATTFIPDFTVQDLDLAIEVKLANEKHGEAQIQHELAEDVAGYRTRWKRLLAVVYDCGVIRDPERMRRENEKHFGVTVVIVKH